MSVQEFYIDDDGLLITDWQTDEEKPTNIKIARFIRTRQQDFANRRQEREETWLEAWADYFCTPQSHRWVRERQQVLKGTYDTDWRHKLSSGKAYEVVETIHAWMMGAFFPNENWFDFIPTMPIDDPQWSKLVRALKRFTQEKLEQADFIPNWDIWLRQCLIVGTSVITLPWRIDTKKTYKKVSVRTAMGDRIEKRSINKTIYNAPDMEVLDMFDVYLDPDARPTDCNQTIIRKLRKTKGELIRLTRQGVYPYAKERDIIELRPIEEDNNVHRHTINNFLGIEGNVGSWGEQDVVECWEYWGDIELEGIVYHDVVATIVGDILLNLETNPFWDGKPFIIGTYVPIVSSPYGIGALDPVLGHVYEINSTMNQRLDNMAVVLNKMFLVRNDGSVDLDQVFTEPGHNIPVSDMDAVKPLEMDMNLQVSVAEEMQLKNALNETTGVTPFIGVSAGRSGERVTAQEIKSQREAGGNRLDERYGHLERTALVKLLERVYAYMQQFVSKPEVVRIRGDMPDSWEYLEIGPMQLSYDMKVRAQGAGHISEKDAKLKNRLDFVQLTAGVPELKAKVVWDEVAIDLASRMLEDDYERFINIGAEVPPQIGPEGSPDGGMVSQPMPMALGDGRTAPVSPDDLAQLQESAAFSGGNPGASAAEEQMMTQPSDETMKQLAQALGVLK